MDWRPLIEAAIAARERAYAPYSGFKVGAAILGAGHQIFAGCNIENRSFGSTVCAERVAIGTAVAASSSRIEALLVLSDSEPPAPPCGLCLQVLTEFAEADLPILLVNTGGDQQQFQLRDLCPRPFEVPTQGLGKLSRP